LLIQGSGSAAVVNLRSGATLKNTPSSFFWQSRDPLSTRVVQVPSDPEHKLAEQRDLQHLRNIDRQVRAHEQAHVSAGGRYVTSGASFRYATGSDGRQYAVAGEVTIDTREIPGNPRATLIKAQTILRAALAPTNPSAQDRRVAAEAIATVQQVRIEMALDSGEQKPGSRLDLYA
jgi:hypothetical protein